MNFEIRRLGPGDADGRPLGFVSGAETSHPDKGTASEGTIVFNWRSTGSAPGDVPAWRRSSTRPTGWRRIGVA